MEQSHRIEIVDDSPELNFEIVKTDIEVINSSFDLAFEIKKGIDFANSSIDIDFEIKGTDIPVLLNVILLDFMETYCVADIFIIQTEGI